MMRKLLRMAAPWVWMAFIFWLSSQPQLPSVPDYWLDAVMKKVGHAVLYAVLAGLWWQALVATGLEEARAARWAFVISTLYGVSDEIHQAFVPGRTPRAFDVFMDALGAALAMRARHYWAGVLASSREALHKITMG